MKYQILSSDNPESLTELVNLALLDGWSPIGGITVLPNTEVAQAMTSKGQNQEQWPDLEKTKK